MAQIGERVVIRYAVGDRGPGGRPLLSDIIGRVVAVEDGSVTLEKRDGALAVVERTSIVTTKVVPRTPKRTRSAHRISAENLTRICTRGWPPVASEPLGEWLLRAAGGFTGRANSVAVHGEPGVSDDAALDRVIAFYAQRGLPARAHVVSGSPWEHVFLEAGWSALGGNIPDGAVVQVAQLAEALLARSPGDDAGVRIEPRASDAWLARYHRSGDPDDSAHARAVLEGPRTVGLMSIGAEPDTIRAIGRVVVTGEWAGLSAIEVDPKLRRQGLGTRIVEAGLRWASDHGADKAYVQTMPNKAAALALFTPYGFREHHTYRYLSPPSAEREKLRLSGS